MLCAGTALAAPPPPFTEEDLSPPAAPVPAAPEGAPAGAPAGDRGQARSRATAPRAPAPPAPGPRAVVGGETRSSAAANPETPALAVFDSGDLSYTVRPGESLGSIAQLFHLTLNELARASRLRLDDPLRVGAVLKIPNPYAAQMRQLQAQLQQLRDQFEQTRRRSEQADDQIGSLRSQLDDLSAVADGLKHDVRILPWWRGAATTAGLAVLVMIGVSSLALLDWYMLRRRFRIVAEMNESLRRLDHKYKATMAKAELRFQQLYGRRRLGSADAQAAGGRIPEDYEIERLNQELRAILEENIERLAPRRRAWRKLLGQYPGATPATTAEARPDRR